MMREDWIEIELKNLATDPKKDIVDGPFGSNLKSSEYVNQGIPVFKIQNIKANRFIDKNIKYVTEEKAETLKRHSFVSGDLIITKLGDPLGLCCEVPSKYSYGIIVADLLRIRPNLDIVDRTFLRYCINSNFIQGQLRKITKGTTRPRVNLTIVRGLKFYLPPLPEQRAIVAKIEQLFSALDQGVQSLEKALAQLKIYRQAVLKKAFEGELTKAWREAQTDLPTAEELLEEIQLERERYYVQQVMEWEAAVAAWESGGKVGRKPGKPRKPKEFPALDKENLDQLPIKNGNWQWDILVNIAELIGGVTKGRKLDGQALISLPYLRVANVQDGYLDLRQVKYMEVLPNDLKKYKLQEGDILYTEGGDKDKLGRGTIWKNEIKNCIHQNHIFRARLYLKSMSSKFIGYYSQTQTAKNYFFSRAKQTTNLASINLTVLSNLPIPICSIQEQHQIVQEIESRLSVCDKLEESIQENLQKAEALRQSILRKAFEGRLLSEAELAACRQEADWEPAADLLERIKAEKN